MRGVGGWVEEWSLKGLNSSDDGYRIVWLWGLIPCLLIGSVYCGWVGGGVVSEGSELF